MCYRLDPMLHICNILEVWLCCQENEKIIRNRYNRPMLWANFPNSCCVGGSYGVKLEYTIFYIRLSPISDEFVSFLYFMVGYSSPGLALPVAPAIHSMGRPCIPTTECTPKFVCLYTVRRGGISR